MKESALKIIKHKLLERHFEESLLFFIIGILCAGVCSLYAWLFALAEHGSVKLFGQYPYLTFLVFPIAMMLAFYLVRRFAPGSSGSGIPQVLASIEIRDEGLAREFLRKMVILVKIFSSFIAIFAGAAIGREGPSLQISAAIAYNTGKLTEKLGLKMKVEQLLIAGAAGGLSAAFNTPIGGVVYAIEELSKEHVRNFRDVLLLSVVISGLTAQLISGNYLFLGYPMVTKNHSAWAMFLIIICALCAGMLGGISSKFLIDLMRWRSSKPLKTQLMIVATLGLIFAAAFTYLGPRNLYSGKESINVVLFATDELPWYEFLTRVSMPVLSSMSGIAGGIFAPALSAGATFGGLFAGVLDPSLTVILGLSGMVGFLTGVTHTPITSFILVLEMTDRHSVVFPMMIAALCASIGAHLIGNESFYEEVVEDIKKKRKAEKSAAEAP